MSGIERSDDSPVGFREKAAVKEIITAPDGGQWEIEKERAVLRKYDGEVSEMTPEQAEQALVEVIVLEDGVKIDHWFKGEERDAPS